MDKNRSLPHVGKLDPASFDEIIFPRRGRFDPSILVGPRHGVDAAVIDLGERVMVVAEDPTFGLPSWGWRRFGWGVVHICAGDVAVLGVKPKHMTICLLLPPDTSRGVLDEIWQAIHEECDRLGIAIVGGHTGSYGGIPYVLNGGCTVWGFAEKDKYVTPAGARPGDAVIVTKGAAIEAAAILALQYPKTLARAIGPDLVKRASETYWQMSVIEDALTAFEAGGVTAMHDATEGGVLGGLFEIAHASGCGIRADLGRIRLSDEAQAICRFFGMDPWASISEGTLVATAQPDAVSGVLAALEAKGIQATVAGEMLPLSEGRTVRRPDGSEAVLDFPAEDPFWAAFFRTLEAPDA